MQCDFFPAVNQKRFTKKLLQKTSQKHPEDTCTGDLFQVKFFHIYDNKIFNFSIFLKQLTTSTWRFWVTNT